MTTIAEVLESIASLAKTQEKGNREVHQKFKELAESREKSSSDVDRKLKELAESREKSSSDVDRKLKELAESREKSSSDVDQKLKELADDRKKLQKTLDKFIGESGHQWGKFIETLTNTGAINFFLLKKQGIQVEMTSTHVKDESHHQYEIDVLAVNGKEMVVIEAKKHLRKRDVDDAIKRFKRFKQYNKEALQKTLYGAVAYLDCEKDANLYAEQKGLFVVQVTGNSAIMNNSQDFKPKPLSSSK